MDKNATMTLKGEDAQKNEKIFGKGTIQEKNLIKQKAPR